MTNLLFALICTNAAGSKISVVEQKFYLEIDGTRVQDLTSKKAKKAEVFTRASKIFTACDEIDGVTPKIGDKIGFEMKFRLGQDDKEYYVNVTRKINEIDDSVDKTPAWFIMHKEYLNSIEFNARKRRARHELKSMDKQTVDIAIEGSLLTKHTAFIGVEGDDENAITPLVEVNKSSRRPAGNASFCKDVDNKNEERGMAVELSYLQTIIAEANFNGVFTADNVFHFGLDFCHDELERTWAIYWMLNKKYPRNKYEFALLEVKFKKYLNGRISDQRQKQIINGLSAWQPGTLDKTLDLDQN